MEVMEGVLHWWPIVSVVGGAVIGWVFRALRDYHRKDVADHKVLLGLTKQVAEMRADLDAIKAGNVAEYQESISTAHVRHIADGEPLTIASRSRINAMMRSLSALDDQDGTYQAMVDDINPCPTLSTVMGHIGWKFENAYRDGRPFDELLEDSECVRVAKRTIGDLKLGNQRCRKCLHRNVCRGGCRVVALANAYVTKPSDEITYYETNPFSCRLFESDVIGRIHRAIREARHVAWRARRPRGRVAHLFA